MFPYRDENPAEHSPFVTIALILLNVLAWVFVQGLGADEAAMASSLCNWGLIPGELTGKAAGALVPLTPQFECQVDAQANWLTLITMQFLHGGWLHLIGNMLFLWVFGNNIEDSMGHVRFLFFYLACGLAAAAAQMLANPASPIPAVGASGAVSGVLGAYLLLFPRVRVWMIVPIFIFLTRIALPAWMYLIYWIVVQFLSGIGDTLARSGGEVSGGGVAFWAHVGGFVAGMVLIHFLVRPERLERKHHRERFHPWTVT